jgi:subfamily B ATP-binding cassette protein MsbA
LRQHLALVSQDAFLFDDSIKVNVALGNEGASDEKIQEALQAAACDFVWEMPEGMGTRAGEGGRNFSGGQKQRIAIARAMLKDAPILLLDEATSALDAKAEAQVQSALESLSQGRTTIVIAHRLSTVRSADRIFVMDKGRVVEAGKHDQLIADNGLYANLVKLQLAQ